jgi:hypothetical protein
MRAHPFVDLFAEVDQCPVDDLAKAQFRAAIRRIAAVHGIGRLEQVERIEFAYRLLRQRVPREVVRDRSMALFEISRTQSYRVIREALKLCQKPAKNGTPPSSNDDEGNQS